MTRIDEILYLHRPAARAITEKAAPGELAALREAYQRLQPPSMIDPYDTPMPVEASAIRTARELGDLFGGIGDGLYVMVGDVPRRILAFDDNSIIVDGYTAAVPSGSTYRDGRTTKAPGRRPERRRRNWYLVPSS